MNSYPASARISVRVAAVALLGLLLGACATYYPAGRDSGVYYETPNYRTSRVAYVDPLLYPYWSLDYFYYSHYYHPYSVVVHRYDPWYYPYPGWYYGYRPGPRFASHGGRFHYPWYRYGGRYAGYRPWHAGTYLSFGYYGAHRGAHGHRVHALDARLDELETRRSLALRGQRPDRQLIPVDAPWLPSTGRGSAVRRGDRPAPPRDGGGNDVGDRLSDRSSQRQSLLQRLRTPAREGRLPQRSERHGERPPAASPRTRELGPRPPATSEPAPARRQRSNTPSPPRSRPQRQPAREPARPTRSSPRPRRDEPGPRQHR